MVMQMLQKFMKSASNSEHAEIRKSAERQKNRYKIQSCVTRIGSNNDHSRLVRKIQFRSSFNR